MIIVSSFTPLAQTRQAIFSTSADGVALALEELKPYRSAHAPLSETAFLAALSQPFLDVVGEWQNKKPWFIQHICPVQVHLKLDNAPADITQLEQAAAELARDAHGDVQPGTTFSVQTRILDQQEQRVYQPFDINQALATACAAQGFGLDVRQPEWVLSLVIAGASAYMGFSTARHNLSNWAGGQRRFKREDEQISRAEFKLLEAVEVFGLALPKFGTAAVSRAADLGAAPGGWTRLLRTWGFEVWAVDPGELHVNLQRDPKVHHIRGTAQQFLQQRVLLDLVVNDMRMDVYESAEITRDMASKLRPGGYAIMTMKLPPRKVRRVIESGLHILEASFVVLGVRQLFHNRHEVTVALQKR